MMKNISKYILVFGLLCTLIPSCKEQYVTYSGPEYVMFADTASTYAVQREADIFKIPVVSTVVCDYDRTFGVEVVDSSSTAIEMRHYRLLSNTVTIKAGQTRADVMVQGYYDNIVDEEFPSFTLQLVINDALEMPLYGKRTKAVLMKSCPFRIQDFTGWCVLSSMFLSQYNQTGGYNRLIYTEKHPTIPNAVICRDWLRDGYDVIIRFDDNDLLTPRVTMDKYQVVSDQGYFFGTAYGEWGDKLMVSGSNLAESVFYPCGAYLYIWTEIYVEEYGVVGHFYNVMQWISDEEADRIKREGF